MERIATGIKAIDTLTGGGLPTGTVTHIFGEKALGKSIISLQAAFATAAAGRSAVVIDTEQSYISYLVPEWKDRLVKRFGKDVAILNASWERTTRQTRKRAVTRSQLITALASTLAQLGVANSPSQLSEIADMLSPEIVFDLEVSEPSVIVVQMPDVIELLALHGIDAGIGVSEGGRVELQMRRTPVYQSALRGLVEKTRAGLIVYDSISAPLKASFPGTQDLPARSSCLAMILSHAQRLSIEFSLSILVTSHVSINPIQRWQRTPYGGVMLGHEAKFSFELSKGVGERGEGAEPVNKEDRSDSSRVVWVQRHPAMADYSRYGYFTIGEEGVK